MAGSSGPTDVELLAAVDRLIRLAQASGLRAEWMLRIPYTAKNGQRQPWALMRDGRVLIILGYTRSGAMDRLGLISWPFEMFLIDPDLEDDAREGPAPPLPD